MYAWKTKGAAGDQLAVERFGKKREKAISRGVKERQNTRKVL
jgi:hypothetical protein